MSVQICYNLINMIDDSQVRDKIAVLKLLADPSRYKIITLLLESRGDICVNDIAVEIEISSSAVSHQLSKLELAGIVSPKRKGQTVCYILKDSDKVSLLKEIVALLG